MNKIHVSIFVLVLGIVTSAYSMDPTQTPEYKSHGVAQAMHDDSSPEELLDRLFMQRSYDQQITIGEQIIALFLKKNEWTEGTSQLFGDACKGIMLVNESKAKKWIEQAAKICPASAFNAMLDSMPPAIYPATYYGYGEDNDSLAHKVYGAVDCHRKLLFLAAQGVDLSAKNKKGVTLIKLAAEKEDWEVQNIVLQQIIAKRNEGQPRNFCCWKEKCALPKKKSGKRPYCKSAMNGTPGA